MSTIIAGHFQTQDEVAQAREALLRAGFPDRQISAFFITPPGQHDLTAIGGDHPAASPGATEAPAGVAEGAAGGALVGAALGAVTAPVTGPVGAVVGGLVGAHVGSLFGLSKMKEAGEHEDGADNVAAPRKAGMLLAVALDQPSDEARAAGLLRGLGAHHIERAEGTIANGDWTDFNPLSLPVIIG